MKYAVSVLDRAWSDADRIFEWIAAKSPQGAVQWDRVFGEALLSLQADADQCGLAPEAVELKMDVRQKLFRTRRGRLYRLICTIIDREVRVLRVRGPGQAPIGAQDIET